MTKDGLSLNAAEIIAATKGQPLQGGTDWICRGVSTDSRTIQPGDLFIALKGERFDGHAYLEEAARKGAAAIVCQTGATAALPSSVPAVAVSDTLEALGDLARHWRLKFAIPLVAITGSSGKTTTKEILKAIASPVRRILATEGNLNNLVGLPHTLFGLRPDHELAIVELGTNRPGEIARLASICRPDVAVITNIGPAHLEGLGSLEAVRREKGALFEALSERGTAVINQDDEYIRSLVQSRLGRDVTFGLASGADVTARAVETAGMQGMRFTLVIAGIGIKASLPLPGRHNVMNALAAAAAAWALGFDRHLIVRGMENVTAVAGRMEVVPLANGAFLLSDTYNANPASMRAALASLAELRAGGRAVAVLGDMLELGEDEERYHREIGMAAAKLDLAGLLLKGPLCRHLAQGAISAGMPADKIRFIEGPEGIGEALKPLLGKGDWVLVKGSRRMKMEDVAKAIVATFDGKGQRV